MAFSLSIYPWVYKSHYLGNGEWKDVYDEKPHLTPAEEAALSEEALTEILDKRNSFPELPLVNYTTQYGMGCFEGLKAFPQKDGTLKLFRPDRNGARMQRSMEGLMMPGFPAARFVEGAKTIVKRNQDLGFNPTYDESWEKDFFRDGSAIYLRPFSYSEAAIGLGLSKSPTVVIVATPVSSYFKPGTTSAVTTDKVRAFPKGTGWIKCDANYVVPTLAKKEAEAAGYMEAVFLDSKERKYLEEGSSCNIFIVMKNGTLVTPALGDTILPGITRESTITLAKDLGLKVEERKISIKEAMEKGRECFVTGTAAGVSYIESLTHKNKTAIFNGGEIGEVTLTLQKTLKGIQYGLIPDKFGWMVPV